MDGQDTGKYEIRSELIDVSTVYLAERIVPSASVTHPVLLVRALGNRREERTDALLTSPRLPRHSSS